MRTTWVGKLACVLNGAPDALLDTYEEERLPVAAWMLGVTSKLHRNALPSDAKDNRRGPETVQLGIAYRDGKLAREERGAPGNLRAGDRAPDAPCHDAAGNSVRLFDLFRGPHFTLLVFGPPRDHDPSPIAQPYGSAVRTCAIVRPGAICNGEAIVDTEGHAHRAYDIQSDTLVLVRPDGYIALIADGPATGRVHGYLRFTFDGAAVS